MFSGPVLGETLVFETIFSQRFLWSISHETYHRWLAGPLEERGGYREKAFFPPQRKVTTELLASFKHRLLLIVPTV